MKRPRSSTLDEEQLDHDVIVESLGKRHRLSIRTGSTYRGKEDDVFSGKILSQGVESSQTIVKNVENNGLDYYYEAGKTASAGSIWSIEKIDEILRVERNFFEFQRLRGMSQEWPADGLSIDDCTAFMQLVADSGQGLLDKKITKRYFLKLVRIFGDLVRPFRWIMH